MNSDSDTLRPMVPVRQRQLPLSYSRGSAKWGSAVSSGRNGYQVLPDILLRSQRQLDLDATDVLVLINITLHWWEPERWPHPRPGAIAKRMGVTVRTVERHILRLCERGLVEWMPWESNGDGPSIRRFNLQGLVEKLEELADENDVGPLEQVGHDEGGDARGRRNTSSVG